MIIINPNPDYEDNPFIQPWVELFTLDASDIETHLKITPSTTYNDDLWGYIELQCRAYDANNVMMGIVPKSYARLYGLVNEQPYLHAVYNSSSFVYRLFGRFRSNVRYTVPIYLTVETVNTNGGSSVLYPGFFQWHTGNVSPPNWIVCDGTQYIRETYPLLWTFAENEINNGNEFYTIGNGTTTFGVKNMLNEFIRGKTGERAIGTWQGATQHPYIYVDKEGIILGPKEIQPQEFDATGGEVARSYPPPLNTVDFIPAFYTSRPQNIALLPIIYTGNN